MSEWQPIETAPKDGTAVYVCDTETWEPAPMIAHWGQHNSWDDGSHWLCGRKDDWPRGKIKREPAIMPTPTHWMPLPAPPEQTHD